MHAQHAWVGGLLPLLGRSSFVEAIVTNVIAGLVLGALQWMWDRCCRRETRDAQRLRDVEEEQAIKRRAQEGGA